MKKRIFASVLTISMATSVLAGLVAEPVVHASTTAYVQPGKTYSVGDNVYFGNYWQNDTNGDGTANQNDAKEPIEWRVLSQNGDDLFLMATKGLDCQPYNETFTDVTWETCTLRTWLNDDFYNDAFSASEQNAIKTTTLVNADNSLWDTEGGNNTNDKVFLLSLSDVTNTSYGFSSSNSDNDTNRQIKATEYVVDSGAAVAIAGNCYWWLRSPGYHNLNAAYVGSGGYVDNNGDYAYLISYYAVCPALHLDLKSIKQTPEATKSASPTPTTAPYELYLDFNDGIEGWYGNSGGGHTHVAEGGIGNSGALSVTAGMNGLNSGWYDLNDLVAGNIYEVTGKVKLAKQNNVGDGRIFISIIYCYFNEERNEWSYKSLSEPSIAVLSNKEIQNESADDEGFCDIAFEFIAPAMDKGYEQLDKAEYPPYKFDILYLGASNIEFYLDDLRIKDVTATSSFGKVTPTPEATATPTPSATSAIKVSGDYEYRMRDGSFTVEITAYKGSKNIINVPDKLGGLTVTSIGASAFKNNTVIQSVILPNTIETIGTSAFESCELLNNIGLNENLKTIGVRAFFNCRALSIAIIPQSVTSIGDYAFGYDNSFAPLLGFTISGFDGTAAQEYAEEYGLIFNSLGGGSDTATNKTKKSIKFTKKSVKIKRGKKVTLKVKLTGAKKATFSVDKKGKKVVKLSKKKAKSVVVKGKKKGKATITAKAAGKTAKCKVTVK